MSRRENFFVNHSHKRNSRSFLDDSFVCPPVIFLVCIFDSLCSKLVPFRVHFFFISDSKYISRGMETSFRWSESSKNNAKTRGISCGSSRSFLNASLGGSRCLIFFFFFFFFFFFSYKKVRRTWLQNQLARVFRRCRDDILVYRTFRCVVQVDGVRTTWSGIRFTLQP